MPTVNVKLKLAASKALASKLPKVRADYWRRRIAALEKKASAKVGAAYNGYNSHTSPAQQPAAQPASTRPPQKTLGDKVDEWTLALANELDAIYQPLAAEAKKTHRAIVDATSEDVSQIGGSLLVPALLAIGVIVAYGWSKGR